MSVKSNESLPTSEEYDFVSDKPYNKSPVLEIVNGDLLVELKDAVMDNPQPTMDAIIDANPKKVGHSIFYSLPVQVGEDPLTAALQSPYTEKQDAMKPDDYSEEEGGFFKCGLVWVIDFEWFLFVLSSFRCRSGLYDIWRSRLLRSSYDKRPKIRS